MREVFLSKKRPKDSVIYSEGNDAAVTRPPPRQLPSDCASIVATIVRIIISVAVQLTV